MGAVDVRRQKVKLLAFKTLCHPHPTPVPRAQSHHEDFQLREMDGAPAFSDLVGTRRLSGFGACLASLPPPVQEIAFLFLWVTGVITNNG